MKALLCGLVLLTCLAAKASVTLTFSGFFNSLTNLSSQAGGMGVNGLTWGIIVDTQRDGFSDFRLDLSENALVLEDGVFLSDDDLLLIGGTTSAVPTGFLEAGDGSISGSVFDPFLYTGVDANDPFQLIWFDQGVEAGSLLLPSTGFGLLTDASFLIPGDGGSVSFESLFSGAEPIRAANFLPTVEPLEICTSRSQSGGAGQGGVQYGIEFEISSDFEGLVDFSLEESTTLEANSWSVVTSSPTVLADDGGQLVLQLLSTNSVSQSSSLFFRLSIGED